LINKIDSSSVLKDGKIEVVHGLPEQQQTSLLKTWYAARRGGQSCKRQASVNDDGGHMKHLLTKE